MKVKELIKELQEYNPEADITLTTSETITLSYICSDGGTKKDSKQIFIEGEDIEPDYEKRSY